ncbi:MAG: OmpA family protein [Deltaproteobacteria bacterium]|nr:OmpA family protein [Deltaproteobacteria bacterium]
MAWRLTANGQIRRDGRVHWTGNTTVDTPLSCAYETALALGWVGSADERDGFARSDDVCPERPEDVDGFEDGDGCPDDDDDRGHVCDAADKRPREGETHNSDANDDGCPDDVPIPLAQRVGVLQGVEFATHAADILPRPAPVLNKVLSVLLLYRMAMVEISGHTDGAGKRERNLELSQLRAEAVRHWLVTYGEDADRISAKGYGPDKPTASNATATGRAKNRRVEFNLVTRAVRLLGNP